MLLDEAVVLPMLVALATANSTAQDWWAGAVEEDAIRSLPLDGDGGLWAGSFVPPPPRPDFLDEHAAPDGLTTCDLCSWAWRERTLITLDTAPENEAKLGWMLTLAIVSILSAAVGAIVMVTVLQCRNRLSNLGLGGMSSPRSRPGASEGDKTLSQPGAEGVGGGSRTVWSWLSARARTPPPPTAAENHYTLEEALYAELDRESTSSPAYQNTAYTGSDTDASAQSSAYYSDLSAPDRDRTYEAVAEPARLAAITETVPSDYV